MIIKSQLLKTSLLLILNREVQSKGNIWMTFWIYQVMKKKMKMQKVEKQTVHLRKKRKKRKKNRHLKALAMKVYQVHLYQIIFLARLLQKRELLVLLGFKVNQKVLVIWNCLNWTLQKANQKVTHHQKKPSHLLN